MKHTLRIKTIKEETLIADNSRFLDVEVEFLDGKKVIEKRKFGFPFGTSEKDIKAELKKVVKTFTADKENEVVEAEKAKVKAESDKTIKNLSGIEINA